VVHDSSGSLTKGEGELGEGSDVHSWELRLVQEVRGWCGGASMGPHRGSPAIGRVGRWGLGCACQGGAVASFHLNPVHSLALNSLPRPPGTQYCDLGSLRDALNAGSFRRPHDPLADAEAAAAAAGALAGAGGASGSGVGGGGGGARSGDASGVSLAGQMGSMMSEVPPLQGEVDLPRVLDTALDVARAVAHLHAQARALHGWRGWAEGGGGRAERGGGGGGGGARGAAAWWGSGYGPRLVAAGAALLLPRPHAHTYSATLRVPPPPVPRRHRRRLADAPRTPIPNPP
jgi:hypothetical protein